MSGSRTSDGRELTPIEQAAYEGIGLRLQWASLHWGTADVSPEAWPHIAIAAAGAIVASVREQVAREIEALAVAMRNGDGWDEEWSIREVRDALHHAARITRGAK